jgi:hypothetical protein
MPRLLLLMLFWWMLLLFLLLCWIFCCSVAIADADFVHVVLAVYVDPAGILVAVYITQTNCNFLNILFTDGANQCSKDKLEVADNSVIDFLCGESSSGSPDTYNDGDVSFHFTTDGSGSGSGFILTYKLVDKPVSSKYDQ